VTTLPDYRADYGDERRTGTRAILFVALALFLIPVILYGVAVFVTQGKVPRGTYVAGIDIGGKSPDAAKRLLRAQTAERAASPIEVTADDVKTTIDPAAAGLTVDVDGTVDRLVEPTFNPVKIAKSFTERTDHRLTTTVDDAKLAATAAAVAAKVDRKAVEGSITFKGTEPVAVLPQTGRVLDQKATATMIDTAYSTLTPQAVTVPVKITPVKSTVDNVNEVLETVAKPAVSGPLDLTVDGKSTRLTPAAIVKLLKFDRGADGKLVPRLIPAEVARIGTSLNEKYKRTPKDAAVDVVRGGPKITPAVNGRKLDPKKWSAAILPALSKPVPRSLVVPFVLDEPEITTAEVKALGIKEVVGEFTTFHPCCASRVTNIHVMADIVDGAMVMPGETFSLNGYVGVRDTTRGFVKAPMILDGVLTPSVGGGVSQFATTMFNAVFFSGLKDVYHKPHSFYINRYPPGREATVSHPEPDLKWTNDSPYGVVIKTSYTSGSITVRFWSTKVYDKVTSTNSGKYNVKPFGKKYLEPGEDCIEAAGEEGFDITVYRHFWKGGRQVKPRERFFTRYVPEPNFICARPPSDDPEPDDPPTATPTPTPTPTPKPTVSASPKPKPKPKPSPTPSG
jgi:vancomycin resistance protein YoaR